MKTKLKVDETKVVAAVVGVVALALITFGCWGRLGQGALAIPGALIWLDMTIWSMKK